MITLDMERIWKVSCDRDECGWRTYVQAETEDEAQARAVERFGCQVRDGKLLCRACGKEAR